MKTCTTCKEIKPLEEFFNSKTYKDGKGYRCKSCDTLARNKYRAKNLPSERLSKKRAQLKFKYNLSYDDYQQMIENQNNLCAICKLGAVSSSYNNQVLVVDHDHTTDKVRGLLCHKCNQALGLFMDSTENLENAILYLKRYTNDCL